MRKEYIKKGDFLLLDQQKIQEDFSRYSTEYTVSRNPRYRLVKVTRVLGHWANYCIICRPVDHSYTKRRYSLCLKPEQLMPNNVELPPIQDFL